MQMPNLTTKNISDTNSLITSLNSIDQHETRTYEKVDKPIGTLADGHRYHCVVLSAGSNEFMSSTPWDRVVRDIITWANRQGAERMGVFYVDMDSQANPLARIAMIKPPEEVEELPF